MKPEEFLEKAKAQISANPLDRVSQNIRNLIDNPDTIYDPHCHIFDRHCVPFEYFILRTFIGRFLNIITGNIVRMSEEEFYELLRKGDTIIFEGIKQEIEKIISDTNKEIDNSNNLSTVEIRNMKKTISSLNFLLNEVFKFDTNKEVLDVYLNQFAIKNLDIFKIEGKERPFITGILMMDIQPGWGFRHQDRSITEQIKDLLTLTNQLESTNTPIIPFLAVDPRRADKDAENLYDLFLKAFPKSGTSFFGVKIYPSLGYLPSDHRLEPIYKICEEKSIPVLTHCGGSFVSTFERETSQSFVLTQNFDVNDRVEIKFERRKDLGSFLNQPEHWEPVLQKFPKLKLDIAHFGSPSTWDGSKEKDVFALSTNNDKFRVYNIGKRREKIIELMNKFDGVYSDFSFNISETKTFRNLKNVLDSNNKVAERTMFGTDFWVVLSNTVFFKRRLKDIFKNLNDLQEDFIKMFNNTPHQERLFKKVPKSYLFDIINPIPVLPPPVIADNEND